MRENKILTKFDFLLIMGGILLLASLYLVRRNPTKRTYKITNPLIKDLIANKIYNCSENEAQHVLEKIVLELRKHAGDIECFFPHKRNVVHSNKLKKLAGTSQDAFHQAVEWLLTERRLGVVCLDYFGEETAHVADVYSLQSKISHRSLYCRVYFAAKRMFCLVLCLFVGLCLVIALRWWRGKRLREGENVTKMAAEIIEFLKNRRLKARSDPLVSASVPLLHVRDELIKLGDRAKMAWIWEKAKMLIETQETRVGQGTILIRGEEFVTWMWIGDD